MSLAPEVKDMYDSREFNIEERQRLADYYEEVGRQMSFQIEYDDYEEANFEPAIKMYHEVLTDKERGFVDELCDYTIGWKYSDQDIVDLCEDLVKEMKGEL